jgi:hypothetical protein
LRWPLGEARGGEWMGWAEAREVDDVVDLVRRFSMVVYGSTF